MKTVKQIQVNNRVRTVMECINCDTTTYTNNGINSKASQRAFQRSCVTCTPIHKRLCDQGWWLAFGLDKSPYVYGPMPRLRTGRQYRMEDARHMGWMACTRS